MTFSTQKKLHWFLLAAGVGSVLFFIALVRMEHLPPVNVAVPVYSWLAAAIAGAVWSIFRLRTLYRREPLRIQGFWHLTLVDLFACAFLTGLCMAVWRACYPTLLLPWGIAMAFLTGGTMIVVLLLAERRGYAHPRVRYPLALATILKVYGLLSLAGVCGIFVLGFLLRGPEFLIRAIEMLNPFTIHTHGFDLWMVIAFWFGIVAFPSGWLFCRLIEMFVSQEPVPKHTS